MAYSTTKPAHRPEKKIDWERVDELLEAGCLGTEIAPHFDMHHDTFYRRVEMEKGTSFTAYSLEKKSKGESLLREVQYNKALGRTEKGDNTLLIWLGKTRLEQRESVEVTVAPDTVKSFNSIMNQLAENQKSRQNESSTSEESCTLESTGKNSQDS